MTKIHEHNNVKIKCVSNLEFFQTITDH